MPLQRSTRHPRVTKTCPGCNLPFSLPPSQMQKRTHCSHLCHFGTLEDRFWRRVKKTDTCWLWCGSVNPNGYGMLGVKGYPSYAHRISWELHFGPIPDRLLVLHRCDIRNCIRPDHLFLGTNQDNMRDKIAKGRQPRGDWHHNHLNPGRLVRGSKHGMAKLTEAQVRDILACHARGLLTNTEMAREYGVTQSAISNIVNQKNWIHIRPW